MTSHLISFLLLITTLSVNAQQLGHLYEALSPDHRYDFFLFHADDKLRFRLIAKDTDKTLGDFVSNYETLQRDNPNSKPTALELAHSATVAWSPDTRYVILDEANNGEIGHELILISVSPTQGIQLPLSMDRMKTYSHDKHTYWTMGFDRWLGNRMFLGYLYGETDHKDANIEYSRIPLVFRIDKDDSVTIWNADE